MPRYRLTYAHHIVINGIDHLLEEGTEVGDGTSYPWTYDDGKPRPPSMHMEGLDDAGRAAVESRLAALNIPPDQKELLRTTTPMLPPPPAAGSGVARPRDGEVPGSGLRRKGA